MSRDEGHEAITRAAWEGFDLSAEQQRALIRGVRAPDVGLIGLLTSALPFAQQRHALRSWSGATTADGMRRMRDFITSRHLRALALPDGARRWATFGEVLHCLQDSYSPAHVDRHGARIARLKHWGPLDRLRRRTDEHGFPTDGRDRAWSGGRLTAEAQAAAMASRAYLALAARQAAAEGDPEGRRAELASLLDECFRAGPAAS